MRTNIVFKQTNGFLGLYLHHGEDYLERLAAGIHDTIINARVDEEGYATRITTSRVIGNDWKMSSGYGLTVGTTIEQALDDTEGDIVLVDWEARLVKFLDKERSPLSEGATIAKWNFNHFVSFYGAG